MRGRRPRSGSKQNSRRTRWSARSAVGAGAASRRSGSAFMRAKWAGGGAAAWLADFTPRGPIEGTEVPLPGRVNGAVIDPTDNTLYVSYDLGGWSKGLRRDVVGRTLKVAQ